MAATDVHNKSFTCSSCDFVVDYNYKGRKPPFAKNILLLEDCYIMKDPFSTSGGFISVGSICSLCGNNVCMSNTIVQSGKVMVISTANYSRLGWFDSRQVKNCSLFYTQRFCLNCAGKNIEEFPQELQQEISQRPNI